jgi:hypothetical protein
MLPDVRQPPAADRVEVVLGPGALGTLEERGDDGAAWRRGAGVLVAWWKKQSRRGRRNRPFTGGGRETGEDSLSLSL